MVVVQSWLLVITLLPLSPDPGDSVVNVVWWSKYNNIPVPLTKERQCGVWGKGVNESSRKISQYLGKTTTLYGHANLPKIGNVQIFLQWPRNLVASWRWAPAGASWPECQVRLLGGWSGAEIRVCAGTARPTTCTVGPEVHRHPPPPPWRRGHWGLAAHSTAPTWIILEMLRICWRMILFNSLLQLTDWWPTFM